jgi:hypothetical protein
MYLTIFLDQHAYKFNVSLHASLPTAEAAFEALTRKFVIAPGETLPPKSSWGGLCDDCGESVHLFRIELDGTPGEEIFLGSSEDLASFSQALRN